MPTSCSSRTTGSAPMCLSAMTWMASRTGSSGPMVQTLFGLKASRYLTRSISIPSCLPAKVSAKTRFLQCGVLLFPSVVVPARAVYVAVGQLFLGRSPHLGNLDVEIQVLPGKRMIGVDRHHVADDLRHRDRPHAVRRLRVQLHPHVDVADALEGTPRNALDQGLVVL